MHELGITRSVVAICAEHATGSCPAQGCFELDGPRRRAQYAFAAYAGSDHAFKRAFCGKSALRAASSNSVLNS